MSGSRTAGAAGPRPDLRVLADPERIAAVQRLVQYGPVGGRLEALTAFAADLLDAPCAQLSLLGASEQVVAAAHGFELVPGDRSGPLEDSLCTLTAAGGQPLAVDDARTHPWVRDLPPVTSGSVGCYLGVVLTGPHGHALGCLCVFGPAPRSWTPEQVRQLAAVAGLMDVELAEHTGLRGDDAGALRVQLAAEAAQLGAFAYDLGGGGSLDGDDRMRELHGIRADSFDGTGAAFQALVHPDDVPALRQRFEQARACLGELVAEYRVLLPEGGTRWIRIRGRVVPDMLGVPSQVLGAAYDASTDRALRDELTQLMETMPAGLVRIDRNWTVAYVNTLAAGLSGRSRSELVGLPMRLAFPDAAGTPFQDAYETAMRTGLPGRIEAYFAPLDSHVDVRIWPDPGGLSLFLHDVSEQVRARQAIERAGDRLAVLAGAGPRLAASLEPDQVLEVLADLVVPDLAVSIALAVTDTVAELLGLSAGNDPSRLHPVHVRHRDPVGQELLRQVVEGLELRTTESSGVGRVVRTGQPEAHPRVPDSFMRSRATSPEHHEQMQRLNTGPQLTIPLGAPGGVLGAFTAAGSDDKPLDDVLLLDLATRAAVALENALSFARQSRAATVLQRALLPRDVPAAPLVQVATRYLPANAHALAGGDFYRTVNVDGRLVCALGDVMGHGTSSAARAGQLHGLVAALALQGLGPGALLTRLAAGIDQMMDLELATLLVCCYDPATRALISASAGHPPPLVAPSVGEPYYLELAPGAPIGVTADRYDEYECDLEPGATVVLFSDGLVERRAESISVGLERLRSAVRELRLPPEAMADHVLRELRVAGGSADDVALLVLSHP